MNKIKQKDLYIIIGIVIVTVIIIWSIISLQQGKVPGDNMFNPAPNEQNENEPAESNTSTSASTSTQTSTSTPTPSLSYGEALKIYEGRRFQFSLNGLNDCVMSPTSTAFKKGTSVMLDNRADKQITVYLDGVAYNIKAYDFKIITLTTSAQLPHTIKVDCGNGKNNGQIILQQ